MGKTKPGHDCQCRKMCFQNVRVDERKSIWQIYNSQFTNKDKNEVLANLIRLKECSTRNKVVKGVYKERKTTAEYGIPSSDGNLTKVCRRAFLSILGIGSAKLVTVLKKMDQGDFGDLRGRRRGLKFINGYNKKTRTEIDVKMNEEVKDSNGTSPSTHQLRSVPSDTDPNNASSYIEKESARNLNSHTLEPINQKAAGSKFQAEILMEMQNVETSIPLKKRKWKEENAGRMQTACDKNEGKNEHKIDTVSIATKKSVECQDKEDDLPESHAGLDAMYGAQNGFEADTLSPRRNKKKKGAESYATERQNDLDIEPLSPRKKKKQRKEKNLDFDLHTVSDTTERLNGLDVEPLSPRKKKKKKKEQNVDFDSHSESDMTQKLTVLDVEPPSHRKKKKNKEKNSDFDLHTESYTAERQNALDIEPMSPRKKMKTRKQKL